MRPLFVICARDRILPGQGIPVSTDRKILIGTNFRGGIAGHRIGFAYAADADD